VVSARGGDPGDTIDTLYYVLIVATVPIFVARDDVVLFSAWRWRMRRGEEHLDGPPIHGNTQLEVLWTALPSALIAALVVYAAIVLHDIGVQKPGEIAIARHRGQQFEWTFSYPKYKRRHRASDRRLRPHLPINRRSSFRDPFGRRDTPLSGSRPSAPGDAVPGITTSSGDARPTRSLPDQSATNLCGYGHSTMRRRPHRHRSGLQRVAR